MRVDTGVYEGGEIPIHYDSMICKLIAVGADRSAAIATMQDALGAFVVRGVSSNIAFQSALLASPRFASGDFNTGFIAEAYPHGFDAGATTHVDPEFLLALAVAAERRVLARSAGITGQLPGHGLRIGDDFAVVHTDGAGHRTVTPATVTVEGDTQVVTIGGRVRRISIDSALRDIAVSGSVDGRPFHAQVERIGLAYRVAQGGAQTDVRVMSPRAAELLTLMPFKPPPDLSRFLLSPMPGLLVDVAVAVGQCGPGRRAAGGDRGHEDGEHPGRRPRRCGRARRRGEGIDPGRRRRHPRIREHEGGSMSVASARPFSVLGIQQVAIGARHKATLRTLWIDMLGLQPSGSFRSERENVDEDICSIGTGAHTVEVDLMEPIDPDGKPAVHATPLNHIGLWIDDLPAAVQWLTAQGVRFAPGGIRRGAAGHDICFLHPKSNDAFPISGEGVLIELVQAPDDVIAALGAHPVTGAP